jgi:hypothetical protein
VRDSTHFQRGQSADAAGTRMSLPFPPPRIECQMKYTAGLSVGRVSICRWSKHRGKHQKMLHIGKKSLNGVESEGSPRLAMQSLAVYASSQRSKPRAMLR